MSLHANKETRKTYHNSVTTTLLQANQLKIEIFIAFQLSLGLKRFTQTFLPIMQILTVGTSEHEFAFVCTMITVNSLGLIFNFLILCMFIRFKKQILTNNKNLLLLSMTVADLCVATAGISGGLIFLFMTRGSTTVTGYKIGGLLPLFGSFFMSILSLGFITTERLVSVKLPWRHRVIVTRKRTKVAIGICWLIVVIMMIVQGLLFLFVSAWTELQVRCSLLGIFFVVGSIILSVSNVVLYRTVQKRAGNHRHNIIHPQPIGGESQDFGSKERQNFETLKMRDEATRARVCIWMTVVFIICWLPVTIYYLLWLALTANPAGRIGLTVCFALVGLNSVLNPVIYLLQRKDFRFYFRKMVCNGWPVCMKSKPRGQPKMSYTA